MKIQESTRWLEQQAERLGLECRVEEVVEGKPTVVITRRGYGGCDGSVGVGGGGGGDGGEKAHCGDHKVRGMLLQSCCISMVVMILMLKYQIHVVVVLLSY